MSDDVHKGYHSLFQEPLAMRKGGWCMCDVVVAYHFVLKVKDDESEWKGMEA